MAILISTRMTTRTGKRMFQTRMITEGMNMKTKRKTIPTKKELLVIGHLPGDVRTKMVLQGEGPGGVKDVARHLNDDEIQYAGFRVTITIDATIMQVIHEPKDVFVQT